MSFTCILAVQRFVFEGCSRGLYARELGELFLSRHPLSCACLSISLAPLPPPDVALPISSLSRPSSSCDCARVLSPFSSVLPLSSLRSCLALPLRHRQRLAITFLKREKDPAYCWKILHSVFEKPYIFT